MILAMLRQGESMLEGSTPESSRREGVKVAEPTREGVTEVSQRKVGSSYLARGQLQAIRMVGDGVVTRALSACMKHLAFAR